MKFVPRTPVPVLAAVLSLWAATAAAQVPDRSLLRQLYGDLAVDVRTKGAGSLMLGVADSRISLVVTVMATDLRRWADSATRILAAPAPRRGQTAKWEAVVSGPGVAAGSMALARRIAPGDTSIVLLVTDAAFQGVRTTLTMADAHALASAMKRAAVTSLAAPPKAPPSKALPSKAPLPKKPPR